MKIFIIGYKAICILSKWIILRMLTVTLILLTIACNNIPNSNQNPLEVLDKPVITEMIDTVSQGESELSWSDFRKKCRNISIVFLQDGCAPCYPKFIEWHRRMENIPVSDDYTVLFVINARHYTNFIRNARIYGEVDERYYHVMDPTNRFLMNNSSIPRTVLDRSLLIDRDSRIKMIGEPFTNGDMTKVFHIVTGVDS